jgi:hypothetical protein
MPAPELNFLAALRALAERRVEFMVIGGVGAVLHGAPMTTVDLDVVHARTADNVERLHLALVKIDACYREHLPKLLRPRIADLLLPGHHLLMTSFGPLDVLGSVTTGQTYFDLVARTEEFVLEPGLAVRVLSLDALIELKEATNREKDRLVLPVLRRTLEELRKRKP